MTTNAMRMLTRAKIPFEIAEYDVDEEDLSGVHAAAALGIEPESMFKTLVARGDKNGPAVFVIPVAEVLDLKKCAAVTRNKSIEMLRVAELLPLTGYVRGGCSPVGMKKVFPTYIDITAQARSAIYVSAGHRGIQLHLSPAALAEYLRAPFVSLTRNEQN